MKEEGMHRTICAAALLATIVAPTGAKAEHGGCLATPAEPTCTYNALGDHTAIGATQDGFEIFVTRSIGGQPTKVVLAQSTGGDALEDVAAFAGELVTLKLASPAGVISSGNTSGHP